MTLLDINTFQKVLEIKMGHYERKERANRTGLP